MEISGALKALECRLRLKPVPQRRLRTAATAEVAAHGAAPGSLCNALECLSPISKTSLLQGSLIEFPDISP